MIVSYDSENTGFMKIVIRPSYTSFDTEKLQFVLEYLLKTEYKPWALDQEAPRFTDCITAIRWLLGQISDIFLPKGYIGDFPNMLLEQDAQEIPLAEARRWDLIFFERMSFTHRKYMIAHVGIMVSNKDFFHSSLHFGWGKISSLEDFDYKNSILDESFLSIARDPRNNL